MFQRYTLLRWTKNRDICMALQVGKILSHALSYLMLRTVQRGSTDPPSFADEPRADTHTVTVPVGG